MTPAIWLFLGTIGGLVVLAVLVHGRMKALEYRIRALTNRVDGPRYLWAPPLNGSDDHE